MSAVPGYMVEVYENGRVIHREFFHRAHDAQFSGRSLASMYEGCDVALSNDLAKIAPLWGESGASEACG